MVLFGKIPDTETINHLGGRYNGTYLACLAQVSLSSKIG